MVYGHPSHIKKPYSGYLNPYEWTDHGPYDLGPKKIHKMGLSI